MDRISVQINKDDFLNIYHNELNGEFESNFLNKFGIEYKEFLKIKLSEYSDSSRDLALFLGIKEKQLLEHMKIYSIVKTSTMKQWTHFLMGNMFVYILKALLVVIGTIPIFYYVGYLILYGYFFGDTDHSLLDVLIKNVPINRSACYIAGFIFSGLVAFWISITKLRKTGFGIIVFGIYFLFASSLSLLYFLFTTNSATSLVNLIYIFLAVWVFPLVTAIVLGISFFFATKLLKYFLEVIAGTVLSIITFAILILCKVELKWAILICVIEMISLSFLAILATTKSKFKWFRKKENVSKRQTSQKVTLKEFISYVLLVISLFIVVIAPIMSFIVFSTGNFLGSSLSTFSLFKSEDISIGDNYYNGKLISDNDKYLYISTNTRRLLIISKDASIKVSSTAGATIYTGKSTNLTIEFMLFYKNEELWCSGTIKSTTSKKIKKLSYSIGQSGQFTLDYLTPIEEMHIVNNLNTKELRDLKFIDVDWYSEDNEQQHEHVELQLKK